MFWGDLVGKLLAEPTQSITFITEIETHVGKRFVKTESGTCIYCLEHSDNITVDHVIPRSWYPDTTPMNQEKWKAPCCEGCNNRYSKIEKNLLERIGLCLDPKDVVTMGIPQKALRALKPSFGKDKKDSVSRAKKGDSIKSKLYQIRGDSLKGVLPHFGPKQGVINESPATVDISELDLLKIGEKLIRGMLYVTGEYYIGPEYEVKSYINTEEANRMFEEWYAKHGITYKLAPGIEAVMIQRDNPWVSLFRFMIWNRLIIHGSVMLAKDVNNLT